MRGDFKLMLFGFFAGLAVGAFALTSVSASIDGRPSRADRQPAAERTLSYDDVASVVRPVAMKSLAAGDAPGLVEYFDARGVLVYRSDPASATTTVSRGTVIPTPTTMERDNASATQRIVRVGEEATATAAAN